MKKGKYNLQAEIGEVEALIKTSALIRLHKVPVLTKSSFVNSQCGKTATLSRCYGDNFVAKSKIKNFLKKYL